MSLDPLSRNEDAWLNPDIDFHSMPNLRDIAEERGRRERDLELWNDEESDDETRNPI